MPVLNILVSGDGVSPCDALISGGPCLNVMVGLPEKTAKARQASGLPNPEPIPGLAVIDTGAARTFITLEAASLLGLERAPDQQGGGIDGQVRTLQCYIADLAFPESGMPTLTVEAVADNLPRGTAALIGRDLLRHFVLVYNGPAGMCTLAF